MDYQTALERFIVDEIMLADEHTRLDPDQSLVSSGILDSLALLRIIAFMDEQLGVNIDDGEVVPDNFETLRVMDEFLKNKVKAQ